MNWKTWGMFARDHAPEGIKVSTQKDFFWSKLTKNFVGDLNLNSRKNTFYHNFRILEKSI